MMIKYTETVNVPWSSHVTKQKKIRKASATFCLLDGTEIKTECFSDTIKHIQNTLQRGFTLLTYLGQRLVLPPAANTFRATSKIHVLSNVGFVNYSVGQGDKVIKHVA